MVGTVTDKAAFLRVMLGMLGFLTYKVVASRDSFHTFHIHFIRRPTLSCFIHHLSLLIPAFYPLHLSLQVALVGVSISPGDESRGGGEAHALRKSTESRQFEKY